MVVLLFGVVVVAIPVVIGFIRSRDQRHVDRRTFAAFVGFGAAIVALGVTMASITADIVWYQPPRHPYYHPTEQGFVAVLSTIGVLSTSIAFIAGLFSSGTRRIALVLFVPVMAIIYLLAAITNFGA